MSKKFYISFYNIYFDVMKKLQCDEQKGNVKLVIILSLKRKQTQSSKSDDVVIYNHSDVFYQWTQKVKLGRKAVTNFR